MGTHEGESLFSNLRVAFNSTHEQQIPLPLLTSLLRSLHAGLIHCALDSLPVSLTWKSCWAMTYASNHVTVAPAISNSAVWTLGARVSLTSTHARLTLPDCDTDSRENCKEDEDDRCNGDVPLHDAVLVYGCCLYAEEVNVIWCMYEVSRYGSS